MSRDGRGGAFLDQTSNRDIIANDKMDRLAEEVFTLNRTDFQAVCCHDVVSLAKQYFLVGGGKWGGKWGTEMPNMIARRITQYDLVQSVYIPSLMA